MKLILKKLLKTILVFILATIIVYLTFTITAFYNWCTENQVLINTEKNIKDLNSSKIQELGDGVATVKQVMEDSLLEAKEEGYLSIAELYDPLGFSVWTVVHREIRDVLTDYINISILSGVAIGIAYAVITSKKMNNILKIAIGYFGVMLMVPQILFLTYFYRFFGIFDAYYMTPNIGYFYIVYTAIFVLIYVINYRLGIKMARELNQTIKEK